MKVFLLLFSSLLLNLSAHSATDFLKYSQNLNLHYGTYGQEESTQADVLFLHGYGDSFENHRDLFHRYNQAGYRVISFDFPSHGKTISNTFGDLRFTSFTSLAQMAETVLTNVRVNQNRPLLISGWSTGGLLAIRMVQALKRNLNDNLIGMILFAPGVAVYPCVGKKCFITNDTLNQVEGLQEREIRPSTPLSRPTFAAKLLTNAKLSWTQDLPNIPILVFAAGDSLDKYVVTKKLKKWVKHKRKDGSDILAYQCQQAFHELDNESIKVGGLQVRWQSYFFARSLLNKTQSKRTTGPCTSF